MPDYKAQVDRLRDWTVLDMQNRPALTIGMMRSAALTIEKLDAEVKRLNLENFWLTEGNNG